MECKVQYRKWNNQRTYTYDPWHELGGGIARGNGGARWKWAKGEKLGHL